MNESESSYEFVGLLTDHQDILRMFISSLVPGSPDVRDLVQEVNIVLWRKRDDFEMGSNFAAWACTVARNKVRDYRKKKARSGWLVFSDELAEMLEQEALPADPLAADARRSALARCLNNLKPTEREMLEQRYQSRSEDMDAFAQKLGRTRASLRVTLCRLRAALRKCVASQLIREGGGI
ncbi:sigma-70 family RNA polymerase sigma factor [Sulfuriroseicoccus oceanibius]|uniref:Sigma-70 family RNA polymerase sigma factor n=1 Tax=Sulfuriroseicoccus oceanibius TaxID=2707525 RepID=A0A6B3LAR1_9BACT|nr:sigma-70 family RNA polymerase sigma factor [Sulfuriroseicoccus oceanibius]QQL45583.1 sigma-70 family RNA polymerase sigma factor [Sulfuriroseicoccus oceanibius]